MVRKILVVFFILGSASAFSQNSTIKAGIFVNADIIDHPLGKLTYPNYEINYECVLDKKWSFSIGYNYAVRKYNISRSDLFEPPSNHGNVEWKNFDHILIPEIRYYLESNKEGIFFQFGLPLTYTVEKGYFETTEGIQTSSSDYLGLSSFGGIGIKYKLSSTSGIEMNMMISPSADLMGDVDYGTSGFIKSGVRFFYVFDKSKPALGKK